MKILALTMMAVLPLLTANALADGAHAEALATIAQRLGYTYAYLPQSDEVSLAAHGVAVIVRPGVPYITVDERVEPVDGDAPRYLDGDLYISAGLVDQLASIARSAARSYRMRPAPGATNPAHINVSAAGAAPAKVTAVELAGVAGSDDVAVSGEATPGALVSIVLTSVSDPLLPKIFLNRSYAVAKKDGSFAIDIPTAPQYFTGATFVAEAAGIDDERADDRTLHAAREVTPLAATLLFGAFAYAAILLSERVCRGCVPFDDGPRPGKPPRIALLAVAGCVGGIVAWRDVSAGGLVAAAILTTALVACSCTDIACGIVPDAFTLLPLAAILAISAFARDPGPVVSALAVAVPFALAALFSRGLGMGWGDVKLVALAGAVLGFPTSIFAFSAACFIAAASAFLRRRQSEPIALVPYLAGSAALALAVPH